MTTKKLTKNQLKKLIREQMELSSDGKTQLIPPRHVFRKTIHDKMVELNHSWETTDPTTLAQVFRKRFNVEARMAEKDYGFNLKDIAIQAIDNSIDDVMRSHGGTFNKPELGVREQMELEPLPMDDDIVRTRQWVNEMNRLVTEITDWLRENKRFAWVGPSKSGLRNDESLEKILRAAVAGCSQLLSREKAKAKTISSRQK